MNIPAEFQGSQAFQLVVSKGWNWRQASPDKIEIETCPWCNKDNYHVAMEIHGAADPDKKRDGLHGCVRCGKSGNLFALRQHLGLVVPGAESMKQWAQQTEEIEPLPDIEAAHQTLLADENAMDYLVNGRGFSQDIIARQKVGLVPKRHFRECGDVPAIVYPYLVNGNCIFVHYRTCPDMANPGKVPKAFSSPKGWTVPLYNGEILREGLREVILVEGEANCIAAMDKGVENICGIPGANVKKAEWIATLDRIEPEKIYICYDKDKVGQRAAQTIASRIGIERCWKITLPDFEVTTDEGETRPGKDLNEWFAVGGGNKEEFDRLMQEASLFDVDGVASTVDAIQEFVDDLMGKEGLEPAYRTQWPSFNKYAGFDKGDVIDILAPEKVGKTTLGLNMMEHMVSTYGDDGIIICLEMTRARLIRKWLAMVGEIEDKIPETPEDAVALKQSFLEKIPGIRNWAAERPGELYLCYPKFQKMDDLYKLMVDCIRRYGVKWIMFDNVQRAADMTSGSKNRTEHLSQISKTLSQIPKDYGIQMIRILQPHRIANGQIVSTDDVDGASQIAKDCDLMITAHRNQIGQMTQDQFESMGHVDQAESFGTDMLLSIGLSRYSGGGRVTLEYDGARSIVREKTTSAVATAVAAAQSQVGYIAQLRNRGITSSSPVLASLTAAPPSAADKEITY